MKKSIALALVSLFILSSCGPRRYRCGPYRKCEKETIKDIKKTDLQNHNSYVVIA